MNDLFDDLGEPLKDVESEILRHEPREKPFEAAFGDEELIKAVSDHVEQHIGPIESVFHEIISDLIHVDVLYVAPTEERPYFTLVTCGMSQRDMNTPPESLTDGHDMRRAELMLCLPSDWKLSQQAFKDENNYWPIRWLKTLARMPHEYDTWLGWGHSIPNGEPPTPFAAGTKLCGLVLAAPRTAPDEFDVLEFQGRDIHFYCVVALHDNEISYKLKHGTDKLLELLNSAGFSEILEVKRPSAIRKARWWSR